MPATATIAGWHGLQFMHYAAPVCMPSNTSRHSGNMYRSVTPNIEVSVTPQSLTDRSSPETGEYFWAYTIEITNRGAETDELRTRHWRITDAMGRRQEVRGPGVVGKQPVLKPGDSFE